MKVYVLETGCYDDKSIRGVYATPEAAMAAWQPKRPTPRYLPPKWILDVATGRLSELPARPISRRTHTWKKVDWGWDFDADYDDAASVTEYEVEG